MQRSQGITVVLSGNGADEIFFGYRGNRRQRLRNDLITFLQFASPGGLWPERFKHLSSNNWADFIREREHSALENLCPAFGWTMDDLHGVDGYLTDLKEDILSFQLSGFLDYFAWSNLRTGGASANFLLPDINGMQAQVEVRSPFLDHQLINLVARLHQKFKIGSYFNDDKNKALLKKIYARYLGDDLAYDKKRGLGWNIRFDRWIIHEKPVKELFSHIIARLDSYDIPSEWFRNHFQRYCAVDQFAGPGGDQTVTGFMLASWLIKELEGNRKLEEYMAPLEHFTPAGKYS
jgi:asparagine synthase (glutamine-hydrolysing)